MNRCLKFVLLGLVSYFISIISCTGSLPSSIQKGPATYYQRMDLVTGGFQRSYRVYLPSEYDGLNRLPLVVVIHGAFDTAKGMEKFSGFSHLANRENFIVLYPEGIGIFGYLQHWNAGHCCGKAANDEIDDVGYLADAIEDVCNRLVIDRNRIYMVGFSNGGMMTYRFAAEHTEMLAAAAPIAASIGGRPNPDASEWCIPKPKKSLPILVIHGLEDADIPFDGAISMRGEGERTYFSVEESVQFWRNANGCEDTPIESSLRDGAIRFQRWDNCSNSSQTVLCTIDGWGHVWPGPYFTAELPKDDPIVDFDVSEIIWEFFKQFP